MLQCSIRCQYAVCCFRGNVFACNQVQPLPLLISKVETSSMMADFQPEMRGPSMTMFESLVQAQMLRHAGNQQFAALLVDGLRAQVRRIVQLYGEAAPHISSEHPQR